MKKNKCRFYQNYKTIDFEDDEDVKQLSYQNLNSNELIAELSEMDNSPCPFYFSKHQAEEAHIVLMPYNYLLDWEIRESKIKLFHNAILVFDEGHNVCQAAETGSKIKFTNATISKAIDELRKIMSKNDDCSSVNKLNFELLFNFLTSFNNYIESRNFKAKYSIGRAAEFRILDQIIDEACAETHNLSAEDFYEQQMGFLCDVPSRFKDLRAFSVFLSVLKKTIVFCSKKDYNAVIDISRIEVELEEAEETDLIEKYVDKKDPPMQMLQKNDPKNVNFKYLKTIYQMFERISKIYTSKTFDHQNYRTFIQWISSSENGEYIRRCVIEITSMVAQETFKEIEQLKPRMMVLTSGTLTPFETIQEEIQLKFPVRFKGKHVIESEDQVCPLFLLIFSCKLCRSRAQIERLTGITKIEAILANKSKLASSSPKAPNEFQRECSCFSARTKLWKRSIILGKQGRLPPKLESTSEFVWKPRDKMRIWLWLKGLKSILSRGRFCWR